jgi:protein tyrosine/serine phosphatase
VAHSNINVPFTNTYWVVPKLFLAGEHPVDLSEDVTAARLTALLDAGVRTFVDLTEERELLQSYSDLVHAMAIERGIDIKIFQMPIPDRGVPSVQMLKSILDVIDASLANKNPVFVHCFAGIGRTGTIVGCYLMRHARATEQNVIVKIAELRSLIPGWGEPSPHTPEQIQLVKSWNEKPVI